jgi:hypothetical protein
MPFRPGYLYVGPQNMLLPHSDAMLFIDGYKAVMLEVLSAAGMLRGRDIVSDIAKARAHATRHPTQSQTRSPPITSRTGPLADDVASAIKSLRVDRWIHVRHTTTYALLVDAKLEDAYAVKALTNPLHEIAGGKAVTFEAGLVEYRGQYVCDGIVLQPFHLGPGIRAELKQAYARIKAAGRFHTKPAA